MELFTRGSAMFRGDISNHQSFSIGVRCENTLFDLESMSKFKKVISRVKSPILLAEMNEDVLGLLNHIYWETEYTVSLVIDDSHYTDKVAEMLDNLPYNSIINVRNISEVTMLLNTGSLSYFVTNDKIDKQTVNSRYAVTVQEFNTILKRNRKVIR